MLNSSGPSSCTHQWVLGDAQERVRIWKAFVRFCLSTLLDSIFQRFLSQMQSPYISTYSFFQDLFSFSFVPTRSCIDIIFYEGTMHASCLVSQKSSVLMGTFKIICWPQPFLNSAWFSPSLFEKKMRGYNKNSPWQSRTIKNYDDCTAELMFDVSIPYIVISIKWKRERLNAALIIWDPIGRYMLF